MAAVNDDGNVPITEIIRNSPGMIQEQQSTNTLRPGAESGSSTTAEQQQQVTWHPAAELGSTIAEQQQQWSTNTSHPAAESDSSTTAEQQQLRRSDDDDIPGDYLSPASNTRSKIKKLPSHYYDIRDADDSEEEYSARSDDGSDTSDEEDSDGE